MTGPYTAEERAQHAQYDRENKAEAMKANLKPVIDNLNAMSSSAGDALALAVMAEHPTLAGQLARGVAIGIMRRVTRDADWKPFDKVPGPRCDLTMRAGYVAHAAHDGRFSCDLVIGAELMARQHFV